LGKKNDLKKAYNDVIRQTRMNLTSQSGFQQAWYKEQMK
jgi:hypothetical protein